MTKRHGPRRFGPYFDVARDDEGALVVEVRVDGDALLRFPLTNKGTAFTHFERVDLGLEGLLPPTVETLDQQIARAHAAYERETTPIARYQFLRKLQDRNEVLFYALVNRYLKEMLPIIYTPTVGEAVERFSLLYHSHRGVSLAPTEATEIGGVRAALAAFPCDDARMIVVTDSSAILGIGDQGYNGLAIPIGKLSLYTVAGGVSPFRSVPIVLDVGTDRRSLRDDPLYLGVRRERMRGDAYFAFVRELVEAVKWRWPKAIIQWEDFSKDTAFAVLERFRDEVASFNDDIQGTGAVALAGLVTAVKTKGTKLADERFLVYGAGAGGAGVALAIREGLVHEGLSPEEAAARVFVIDSKGLIVAGRAMEDYKQVLAQPADVAAGWKVAGAVPTLRETIEGARITALLGLSGQGGAFGEDIVRAVAACSERPIVFALSNPTSACEATPADIVAWTGGRAIVATGSPFDPVEVGGKLLPIGQGNNAFIFPGLGFGAILARATKITAGMVAEASYALSDYTTERYPDLIYPPVEDLHEVSGRVAARVIQRAVADGVSGRFSGPGAHALPKDLVGWVKKKAWAPQYLPFRRAEPVSRVRP